MIPAAVADSLPFWLAIIGGLTGGYILTTVIGIARQVEYLGLGHLPERVPGWVACGADPRLLDSA